MKSKLILLMLSTTYLLLLACGGSKQAIKTENQDVQPVQSEPPKWFTNVPQDSNFMFASATATSKDLQMAINKAQQQGRLGIVTQVETRFEAWSTQVQKEIGLDEQSEFASQMTITINETVSATLIGCKTKSQITTKEGELWRAWVLMEYPIGEANAKFLQALKGRDDLLQKVEKTKPFKELEPEVKKYPQEKVKKK